MKYDNKAFRHGMRDRSNGGDRSCPYVMSEFLNKPALELAKKEYLAGWDEVDSQIRSGG